VREVGGWEESVWHWRLRWRRVRYDWESEQEQEVLSYISRGALDREESDLLVWGKDVSGEFSVKSVYVCLANYDSGLGDTIFKRLWQIKALPNVLTTAWRILWDRLPTRTNLIRREVEVTSLNCVLCQASEESAQHLFLECTFAQQVWSLCLKWIAILFVQHKDMKHHFERFHLTFMSFKQESGVESYMGDKCKVYLGAKKFYHL